MISLPTRSKVGGRDSRNERYVRGKWHQPWKEHICSLRLYKCPALSRYGVQYWGVLWPWFQFSKLLAIRTKVMWVNRNLIHLLWQECHRNALLTLGNWLRNILALGQMDTSQTWDAIWVGGQRLPTQRWRHTLAEIALSNPMLHCLLAALTTLMHLLPLPSMMTCGHGKVTHHGATIPNSQHPKCTEFKNR